MISKSQSDTAHKLIQLADGEFHVHIGFAQKSRERVEVRICGSIVCLHVRLVPHGNLATWDEPGFDFLRVYQINTQHLKR